MLFSWFEPFHGFEFVQGVCRLPGPPATRVEHRHCKCGLQHGKRQGGRPRHHTQCQGIIMHATLSRLTRRPTAAHQPNKSTQKNKNASKKSTTDRLLVRDEIYDDMGSSKLLFGVRRHGSRNACLVLPSVPGPPCAGASERETGQWPEDACRGRASRRAAEHQTTTYFKTFCRISDHKSPNI